MTHQLAALLLVALGCGVVGGVFGHFVIGAVVGAVIYGLFILADAWDRRH